MKAGDVVLVRFPFADLTATKKRPALAVAHLARSQRYRIAIGAMITSQVDAWKLPGDVLLLDWQAAGLLHPGLLRFAKIAANDAELAEKSIGRLSPRDLSAAKKSFAAVFEDWQLTA